MSDTSLSSGRVLPVSLDAPLLTVTCLPSQAITTEGKYWKSRIEIVIREYHKWRTYFKKRVPGLGSEKSVCGKPP